MQNDLYSYINQLALQVKKHEEKLMKLEKTNTELLQIVENLKNQPAVNVEQIDYHFDQLKIERLDGTLNIGLNPQDLQKMDEFSIPKPFRNIQKIQPKDLEQLRNKLDSYINHDLPTIIEKSKEKIGVELDESYTKFIQEDIQKQLPDRISFYSKKLTENERNLSVEEETQEIFRLIIQDIEQAVATFLQQFPMKGQKGEGEKNES